MIERRKMAVSGGGETLLVEKLTGKREENREKQRGREEGRKKVVRTRLDTLDVGGRSVVWHITPLIQCISGCEQLARKSQLPRFQPPLQLRSLFAEVDESVRTPSSLLIYASAALRYKCHYFRITGAESYSSVNREPFSHPISSLDR